MYVINEHAMLPDEIWENVLLNLLRSSPKSFLSAAKACDQWRLLAIRICRKFCLNKLQKNLLSELCNTRVTHQSVLRNIEIENGDCGVIQDEDCLQVFNLYLETQLRPTTDLPFVRSLPHTTPYVFDPFLLLITYQRSSDNERVESTCIRFYSFLDFPPLVEISDGSQSSILSEGLSTEYVTLDLEENICSINFLFLRFPVLLFRSKEVDHLRCFVLVKGSRLTKKDLVCVSPRMLKSVPISSEGRFVLAETDKENGSHILYEAHLNDGNKNKIELSLTVLYSFSTGFPLCVSELFKGHFKSRSRTGRFFTFKLPTSDQQTMKPVTESKLQIDSDLPQGSGNSSTVPGDSCSSLSDAEQRDGLTSSCELIQPASSSTIYKDLRYPNKTTYLQDWTFTSTAVSSELLFYWHMDAGREFSWLIGYASEVLNRWSGPESSSHALYNLQHVRIGVDVKLEVTAIMVSRGILICGTSDGRLLIYKLLEEFQNKGQNLSFLTQAPWMNIPLTSVRIFSVFMLWTSLGLLAVARDHNHSATMCLLPLDMS